jgi:hypothetical protein
VRKLLSSVLILCLSSFTVLAGCARSTANIKLKDIFADVDEKLRAARSVQATNIEQARKDTDEAFEIALGKCQSLLSRLEVRATGFQWSVVGIALLGSIAGAVLIPAFNTAPLANKALVSALGGVSGVANTAQNTMRKLD